MADLTLENIQNMRKQLNGHPDSVASGDTLLQLLDAAERGLSNDRKAAAFDRMAEFTVEANDKHDWVEVDFNGVNFTVNRASGERDYAGKTLLEAVEQLPEANHESK